MIEYQLFQDGMMVAGVCGTDREWVLAEINHYAFVYSQDGPVEIKEIKHKKSEPRSKERP